MALPSALDTTAREQRTTGWARGQEKRATSSQQQAELPDLKGACPDDAAINAPVVPEVRWRVARSFPACFRRGAAGATPGSPRCPGWGRSTACTSPQGGAQGGARREQGVLVVLATIGRIAVRWARPLAGTAKTGTIAQEAAGWYAGCPCAAVPVRCGARAAAGAHRPGDGHTGDGHRRGAAGVAERGGWGARGAPPPVPQR